MTVSLLAWIRRARLSASGASDSPSRDFLAWSRNLGAGVPPSFPPSVVVQVKALACELPHRLQLPLSRLSLSEIRREVITQGLVAEVSGATLWRWLSADALRPWRHRSWIFPRDPDFAAKAGRILDLYDRVWQGRPLSAREFVISADEKSSIQARRRKQPTLSPAPGRSTRVSVVGQTTIVCSKAVAGNKSSNKNFSLPLVPLEPVAPSAGEGHIRRLWGSSDGGTEYGQRCGYQKHR
jgi:hypothetical protein